MILVSRAERIILCKVKYEEKIRKMARIEKRGETEVQNNLAFVFVIASIAHNDKDML
jgi:hypothetical protein